MLATVKPQPSPLKSFDDLDSIVSNLKTDLNSATDSNHSKPSCDDDEMIEMTSDDNLVNVDDVGEIGTTKTLNISEDISTAIQQNLKIAGDCAERPLSNYNIGIDAITPGDSPPRIIMDEAAGLKIILHFAKDRPRDDISVIVVTTTNHNSIAIKDYQFDASVSKVGLVRLFNVIVYAITKNCRFYLALQVTASTSVRYQSSWHSTISSSNERHNTDTAVVEQGPCLTKNHLHS